MFEFKRKDGSVSQLGWGTWAMKKYCDLRGFTIQQYFEWLGQDGGIPILDVPLIIKVALDFGSRGKKDYSEFDAAELIDEDGGVLNPNGQIKSFFQWIVESHTVNSSETQEEKKSPNE